MKKLLHKIFDELFVHNSLIVNYKRMWPFVKPYWFRALLGIGLAIPVGGLDAVVALFLKPYTDDVLVAKNATFASYIPLIIVGFVLLQSILTYSVKYLTTWVGQKITLDVRKKLFTKLLSMNTAYFDTSDSGHIMMRYNQDADTACRGLINNLRLVISKYSPRFHWWGCCFIIPGN